MACAPRTFGVFPHDLRRGVPIHRAVQHPGFAVDAILVVGLDHEARRHWGMGKKAPVTKDVRKHSPRGTLRPPARSPHLARSAAARG